MNTKHNIQPTEDRVLIIPESAEEKTAGGIIIPQEAKEKSQIGIIKAVGVGTKEKPMELKVDQRILYSQYSGTEVKLDGQKYLILRSSDVVAILS